MKLNCEYLPAAAQTQQELVLLHGWGVNREVWRPLLAALRPWANVSLVDIPGLAPGYGDEQPELAEVVAAIAAQCSSPAVYLGWSLGGQLALALAAQFPDQVDAVVTLCSNPCFARRDDWPGMCAQQLAGFQANADENMAAALRRFDSLQFAGVINPRPLMRTLQAQRSGDPGQALAAGLGWLAQLDQRDTCQALQVPQLHLHGQVDGLLSQALPGAMQLLLAEIPAAEMGLLPNAGHPAPLQAGQDIAARTREFLQGRGLLRLTDTSPSQLAKTDVAESFSRAAGQYDSVAQLQRDVGTQLLQQLEGLPRQPLQILDLGSGTGYFAPELCRRFPEANYIGLDLAQGMVCYARDQFPDVGSWLAADAEALPLAAESVDLVFSSLAVQWCYRPELLFAELARVLRPGGRCVFTSLGPDTLKELRASWAAVDDHQHVNSFLPADRLQRAAEVIPGVRLTLEAHPYRMEYKQARELLSELKTLGAHNVNRDRPAGLTGRRALTGMLRAYESWREEGVLPATYEVFFGVLEKQ